MHRHERIEIIKDILQENGKVMINDLAERFSVSKVSIRNDLDLMTEQGFVQRFHGGAVPTEKVPEDNESEDFASYNIFVTHPFYKTRKNIATAAAKHVLNGDTIFLGSGMTCCLLAKALCEKENLTVITNNISALPDLLSFSKNVVIIGGEITSVDNKTYFSWTEDPFQYMKNLFVNKAFTSCTGVDLKAGITVNSIVSTYVYKCIPDIKREWFLLVEQDKFDKIGLYVLNSLKAVDCIISDNFPEDYFQYLSNNNITAEKI